MQTMEAVKNTAGYLRSRMGTCPEIAIVLGSGLGDLTDRIEKKTVLAYQDIPGFPVPSVPGHAGQLVFGELGGKRVVAMKGRFHYYEGNPMDTCVFPIRVFRQLGIENLLITNAAGGVNLTYRPGTLMLLTDQIGLFAENPLRGENWDEFGPRFPDMSRIFDSSLLEMAKELGHRMDVNVQAGVYAYCKGPSFETPAEIRALRILGADAVGMSTVPETIVARHAGMRVLGISCITNMAAGVLDQTLSHEEVMETGRMVARQFADWVTAILSKWPASHAPS